MEKIYAKFFNDGVQVSKARRFTGNVGKTEKSKAAAVPDEGRAKPICGAKRRRVPSGGHRFETVKCRFARSAAFGTPAIPKFAAKRRRSHSGSAE